MSDVNLKVLNELKEFLEICIRDSYVMDVFRKHKSDFVRNRKLSFKYLVLFIIKLNKRTLSVELDDFFENECKCPLQSCSVSAFSQQRKKLEPLFFQVWNEVLYRSFYHYAGDQVKRWRGYRVIAADGSVVSLIGTKTLSTHFGGQSNQRGSFTGAKTLLHFDILNKLFTHAYFTPYRIGELTMAYAAIEQLPVDSLTIYDRNFCNYKMVALHSWQEQELKFVIRGNENQKMIVDFIKSGVSSKVVKMEVTPSAIKGLKLSGFTISPATVLHVRLIRVELTGGTTEVLLTNLWEEEGYETALFKDLYNMRWGIETGINTLKNLLELESFSGLSVESVQQDFFATLFTHNLSAILINHAQQPPITLADDDEKKLGRPKTRNWATKTNVNKATGKIRQSLVRLFIDQHPGQILEQLYAYFSRHQLPIRPGRTYPRQRKNKQSLCKHKTYSNFKRAA